MSLSFRLVCLVCVSVCKPIILYTCIPSLIIRQSSPLLSTTHLGDRPRPDESTRPPCPETRYPSHTLQRDDDRGTTRSLSSGFLLRGRTHFRWFRSSPFPPTTRYTHTLHTRALFYTHARALTHPRARSLRSERRDERVYSG